MDIIKSVNSAQAALKEFNESRIASELFRNITSASAAYKGLAAGNSISEILKGVSSAKEAFRIQNESNIASELFNNINSASEAYKGLTVGSSISEVLKSFNSAQEALRIQSESKIASELFKNINSPSAVYKSLAAGNSISEILKSVSSAQAALRIQNESNIASELFKNISSASAAYKGLGAANSISEIFHSVSSSLETYQNYAQSKSISELLESIDATKDALRDFEETEHINDRHNHDQIANRSLNAASTNLNERSIGQYIYLKIILVCLIVHVILPILQNIAANLITPHIQSIIDGSNKEKKEQVKQISNIKIKDINFEQYRFVTVDHLILRESPKSKSRAVDNLKFGQVLTVVSKSKNWLEVSYEYEDGTKMHGWVFLRYTQKFEN